MDRDIAIVFIEKGGAEEEIISCGLSNPRIIQELH